MRAHLFSLLAASTLQAAPEIAKPKSSDPRIDFTLVASEPAIVTPIGVAVDRRNRLFVVESHTHHRPADYTGPSADVVKAFLDTDGNGTPDTPTIFADGLNAAMNLALSPADELHLVHRSGVVRLDDADHNGVCEKRTTIVEVETAQNYPHNGLNGIVFGRDGWLYLGMGENFSAPYSLRGTDGSVVHTVAGRGGKVFRCRIDGSRLEEVAAGFWNPFGLELDRTGRLFCVDNDPGGRPPCRLLHVVPGGDYGYRRRYADTHVFNGWDGELPGTLPMLAPTGEAPCGIISTDRLALPTGYEGALLVASWGDAAIELYRLQPQGASFRAAKENLVAGEKKFNEAFCPVDVAAAPDGSLIVTDWADRTSYPVHRKGRIWRLAAKPGVEVRKPAHAEPLAETNAAALRMERILAAGDSTRPSPEVKSALADSDPFIRSAAITALSKPTLRQVAAESLDDANPAVRVGALAALWRAQVDDAAPLLRRGLADPDERVRLLSLQWAGEDRVSAVSGELGRAMAPNATPTLFNAYLAASELLASEPYTPSSKPDPAVRQQLLSRILHDNTQPPVLHAMAAAAVTSSGDDSTASRLLHFARQGEAAVRREAVCTLATSPHPDVPGVLTGIALDTANAADLRADAILALARRDPAQLTALVPLLADAESVVQLEAARAMRLAVGESPVRQAIQARLESLGDSPSPLREQLQFALQGSRRPATPDEWRSALAIGGDAESGRRVFLGVQTGCTTCHQAQGRGTSIGPDLSHVASSLNRTRLIDAILDPSREIAPQYEHHIVETKLGKTYSGVLVHIGLDASPLINAIGAGRVRVPVAQVARHETSKLSMMPSGLEHTMTIHDFRDLLAYLLTLK